MDIVCREIFHRLGEEPVVSEQPLGLDMGSKETLAERRRLSKQISAQERKKTRQMLLTLIEKAVRTAHCLLLHTVCCTIYALQDFLVDKDLVALVSCLSDRERLLVKLDSILGSLGVQTGDELTKFVTQMAGAGQGAGRGAGQGAGQGVVLRAEQRSKLMKALRQYVEEPARDEQMFRKHQAVLGTFSILQSVAGSIQPDREGQLWEELREWITVFRSPDRLHLKQLLTKYKDVLLARAHLIKRNSELREQNLQLSTLLQDQI